MKKPIAGALVALAAMAAWALPPSFQDSASPAGWTNVKGRAGSGDVLQAAEGGLLDVQTIGFLPLPVEAIFRFRASPGDRVSFRALEENKDAKPLLESAFSMPAGHQASVTAKSAGEPMATEAVSSRHWGTPEKKGGGITYQWRFPGVKNLWDDRDCREIGADYARLTPFAEKVFTLRMSVTPLARQIWLDDRLVAEDQTATTNAVRWAMQLAKTAKVLSAEFSPPAETGRFLPLPLEAYSHARRAQAAKPECERVELDGVPARVPKTDFPDIDLGDSLYRYRLTHGSGPEAGYVNGISAWPGSFRVDPALLAFRVPYRNYQNVWLLAWVDERPNTVARGTLRFFREKAGYPASTDLEISDSAIKKGLVKKLDLKTAGGKALYLVKVPVNTAGLYGMRDMADQFLEFELSKPVALGRSYPDPIYYGFHPAGLPSSIHVVGITLEEAPFGFAVEPKRTHYVFESPEKPAITVCVTNTTTKALKAEVRAETVSYDGAEKKSARGNAVIPPGKSGTVGLEFDLKTFGWHGLKVDVEAGGAARAADLSLVVIPPNARTYGYAPNETRFGIWELSGHYAALTAGDFAGNERILSLYRTLGLRRVGLHRSFVTEESLKRLDLLPNGPHTVGNRFRDAVLPDGSVNATSMAASAAGEVASVPSNFPGTSYFYGGEWAVSEALQYAPWPAYTDEGDRDLTAEERTRADRHVKIFSAIGKGIRAQRPGTKLVLQWGAPLGTIAYMRAGMPRDLVDLFGMDAPQFELLPEISNVTGSINLLWALRRQAARLGWANLPIAWCEGPFFPTMPGALTEAEQAAYQVRYTLLALAYGVEQFEAGIVPQDAGNYYGAEHYGAGLFHRRPLENPKPAVAAFATATAMLCGADVVGPVETGNPTTYCLAFRRAKDAAMIYALWRVNGTGEATVKVSGARPVATDSMGNPAACAVKDGAVTLTLSPLPVWLTGAGSIGGIALGAPVYAEAPAAVTRPLAPFTADRWGWDGSEDKAYAHNHFAMRRITDPNLKAEFGQGEEGHADAVAITLPVEAAAPESSRPLATRYGQLMPREPVAIPGKASALGVWIKGNSSWGRVVYQCRDAKGEVWTSVGTKDDWNCDDTHAWSYVSFEGWRYVRFPLPGSKPWDGLRDLETTWWGSRGGDAVVDLPLTLEKFIVEARDAVPVLGEMTRVPERSYKLAGLVAEYEAEGDAGDGAVAASRVRMPLPEWSGPAENPIARLAAEGAGAPPVIKEFVEPPHFNDGRSMLIRFAADPALTYNLYLSRFADGRGADLLVKGVKDGQPVTGLRPELKMYLFLTAAGADKAESKPSKAFELVTHDNFAEK
jgi:hypothetical protein